MTLSLILFFKLLFVGVLLLSIFSYKNRKYQSSESVSSAYDAWTNDRLLESLWGEHVHLGFYKDRKIKEDFRQAKVEFVHQLVRWSGLDKLPKGSRILDVGCGIGGSARILANDYGFDVVGISISEAQIKRANSLTKVNLSCDFKVMDALDLQFPNGSFDGVWSVEAGPHMPDKQLYADEMLRVLRPGGVFAIADWNKRNDSKKKMNSIEKVIMNQLLNQWSHPSFASINGFRNNLINSKFSGGQVEAFDWTDFTIPSWIDSIAEGFRRPNVFFKLGPIAIIKGFREMPTILLMHWAFSTGLMQFGVFKGRG